jgi:hypothetical protein
MKASTSSACACAYDVVDEEEREVPTSTSHEAIDVTVGQVPHSLIGLHGPAHESRGSPPYGKLFPQKQLELRRACPASAPFEGEVQADVAAETDSAPRHEI